MQTTPVVTAFPSQQFVVLNATGYVVAQRKAAISSKATGRLEWLGVAEGSRVKAGDIIARIDSRDVVAQSRERRRPTWRRRARRCEQAQAEAARRRRAAQAQPRPAGEGLRLAAGASTRRRRAPTARPPASRNARAALAAAEANARNAEVAVDYTLIRAPSTA